ncbi:MAG: hypothetical protein ACRC54_02360 [Fusobacteriaceae bacterium]
MRHLMTNLKLSKLLLSSSYILKDINKIIEKDFSNFPFKDEITFDFKNNSSYSEVFKKNFFTLLMISILIETRIPKERIISYGKIIILLRQIVTSTDNIIDNEANGNITFKSLDNIIVKNNFLSLICQDLLTKECLKLSNGDFNTSNLIFKELYRIAFSESLRDSNLYENYPSSDYILNKIHNGIGGTLLEISLVVPKFIEENTSLDSYSLGLYEIGMSLQAIDDLFDVQEDLDASKINLALSKFLEKNPDIRVSTFDKLDDDFSISFLEEIIQSAFHGFSILRDNGFPISHSDAKHMLRKLFKLRGLKEYVEIIN